MLNSTVFSQISISPKCADLSALRTLGPFFYDAKNPKAQTPAHTKVEDGNMSVRTKVPPKFHLLTCHFRLEPPSDTLLWNLDNLLGGPRPILQETREAVWDVESSPI